MSWCGQRRLHSLQGKEQREGSVHQQRHQITAFLIFFKSKVIFITFNLWEGNELPKEPLGSYFNEHRRIIYNYHIKCYYGNGDF